MAGTPPAAGAAGVAAGVAATGCGAAPASVATDVSL